MSQRHVDVAAIGLFRIRRILLRCVALSATGQCTRLDHTYESWLVAMCPILGGWTGYVAVSTTDLPLPLYLLRYVAVSATDSPLSTLFLALQPNSVAFMQRSSSFELSCQAFVALSATKLFTGLSQNSKPVIILQRRY